MHEGVDRVAAIPALLAAGAEWLLLEGITRILHYWAKDVDPPDELALVQRAGFAVLVRNERGFTRPA